MSPVLWMIRHRHVQTCQDTPSASRRCAKQTIPLNYGGLKDKQEKKDKKKRERDSDRVLPCPLHHTLHAERGGGVYLACWWNVCVAERYADRVQITE